MIKKSARFPTSMEPRVFSTPRANAEFIVLAANDSLMLSLKSMQARLIINGFKRIFYNIWL
jgi:hypothetical protein